MSSLVARLWLTAAREACSMSLMHLLIPSMEKSHSRWPGALSLEDRDSKLCVVRRRPAPSWTHTSVSHCLTKHKACGKRATGTEVSFVFRTGFWYMCRELRTLSYTSPLLMIWQEKTPVVSEEKCKCTKPHKRSLARLTQEQRSHENQQTPGKNTCVSAQWQSTVSENNSLGIRCYIQLQVSFPKGWFLTPLSWHAVCYFSTTVTKDQWNCKHSLVHWVHSILI